MIDKDNFNYMYDKVNETVSYVISYYPLYDDGEEYKRNHYKTEAIDTVENRSDWIPTNDVRKPDFDKPVLLSCNCGAIKRVVIGYYSKFHESFTTNEMFIDPDLIKAWQPLPEPY